MALFDIAGITMAATWDYHHQCARTLPPVTTKRVQLGVSKRTRHWSENGWSYAEASSLIHYTLWKTSVAMKHSSFSSKIYLIFLISYGYFRSPECRNRTFPQWSTSSSATRRALWRSAVTLLFTAEEVLDLPCLGRDLDDKAVRWWGFRMKTMDLTILWQDNWRVNGKVAENLFPEVLGKNKMQGRPRVGLYDGKNNS